MDVARISSELVAWIKERGEEAGAKGAVMGISGGVDSALVAVLCKGAFPDNVLGLIMPCHSQPEDAKFAHLVAKECQIPVRTVDLSHVFDALLAGIGHGDTGGETCRDASHVSSSPVTSAVTNIKPRLRMTTLYYFASRLNYLVVGTGNRSELTVGYFTKYGDGGVDILPLGGLVKEEVRELARYLGVPDSVVDRVPSAGLWVGQTDEGEMGITYAELDRFILTGEGRPEVIEVIGRMNKQSEHKRKLPPIPNLIK